MKQVININFQGRVVPIEVSAFEILKQYIDSLNRHFSNEIGKEEIINDIENRIGELFQERINAGANCITEDHVNAVIASMGKPEEFDNDSDNSKSESTAKSWAENIFNQKKRLYRDEVNKKIGGVCSGIANYFDIDVTLIRVIFILFALAGFGILFYLILWIAVPGSSAVVIGGPRKRLYRDTDEKIVGGVCSGLGHYFGINPWIPRAIFLIFFFSLAFRGDFGDYWDPTSIFRFGVSPGVLLVYLIAWLVIPEAKATSEKLEMRGEKVDFNSIKNSVVEEMKGLKVRAEKFGNDSKAFYKDKVNPESAEYIKHRGRSFGDVILLLIKIFFYIILGIIAFSFFVTLLGLGAGAVQIFPLKNFVLKDGWETYMAWGTLIFFIIAPIVGLITWAIRRLARIKSKNNIYGYSFASLWIIGWFCVIALVVSLKNDFRASSDLVEVEIPMENPMVQSLTVSNLNNNVTKYRRRWNFMGGFNFISDDTIFVNNIRVHIAKAPNDSFKITSIKMSDGSSRREANQTASYINFNAAQKDSTLIIDKGIAITKNEKFRNQMVVLTVYVPVGKKIKVDKRSGRYNRINFGNEDMDIFSENIEQDWSKGVTYIMTENGLVTLDGVKAADDDEPDSRDKVIINSQGIHLEQNSQKIIIDKNGIEIEKMPKPSESAPKKLKKDVSKDSIVVSLVKLPKELEKPKNEIGWKSDLDFQTGYNPVSMGAY